MIKPNALRIGDTIGVMSPGIVPMKPFSTRIYRGQAWLKELGFNVKFGRQTARQILEGTLPVSDHERADELHELFQDPEVTAIMFALQGPGTNSLLPLLDYQIIGDNPKIIMGYSAATELLNSIYANTGLVTFHGPALIPDFGDLYGPHPYTLINFIRVLQENLVTYFSSKDCSNEFINWQIPDAPLPTYRQNSGWRLINPGVAKGRLIGGSLWAILNIMNSKDFPGWGHKSEILFWDAADTRVDDLKRQLRTLQEYDLGELAGMIVGKYSLEDGPDIPEFDEIVENMLIDFGIPVLLNADTGHTRPIAILPIGVIASLDVEGPSINLLEAAVQG